MAPTRIAKPLLAALFAADSVVAGFSTLSSARANAILSLKTRPHSKDFFRLVGTKPVVDNHYTSNTLHKIPRGGGPPSNETAMSASASSSSSSDPAAKNKKVRIAAFDSMRFFLITCIVLGHFIRFAGPSDFVFKFFSHHNVLVGAFFVLSGYVTAYTTTENAKREASPKLLHTPKQQWILSRVFGYYPLHLATLLLFAPMFLFADFTYNGWPKTLWNGFAACPHPMPTRNEKEETP